MTTRIKLRGFTTAELDATKALPSSIDVHRFEIGTRYLTAGKHPKVCTVTDQLTVTNAAGEVVKRYYTAQHFGPGGQPITDRDVCDTTVARGIWRLANK